MNLKGRHFLKLLDYTPEEITYLLDLAADLKDKKKKGIAVNCFQGKNVALIFEKTSTRTRCAFEVAAHDLGLGTTYLDPSGSQIGKKESIADTARVLGRMYEGIEYRGFGQNIVEELAQYAGVPVWNGLTNEFHPTQMLADLLTIREHLGRIQGVKLVYMGDARYNMGNSYMVACAKMGMHFTACAPKEYFPDSAVQGYRGPDRRKHHAHGGCRGRNEGCGCDLYRCMGIHGRAGLCMGRTYPSAFPLPGKQQNYGKCGKCHLYALSPCIP